MKLRYITHIIAPPLLLTALTVLISPSGGMTTPLNEQAREILIRREPSESCSLAVIGDVRKNDYGGGVNQNFADMLSDIAAINPDLIIIPGDMVMSGLRYQYIDYHRYICGFLDSTGIPVFHLPGNHDLASGGSHENYAAYIDTLFDYFFDFGNNRFIMVDNVERTIDSTYLIGESRLDSVEAWLRDAPGNCYVFTHVPVARNEESGGYRNPGFRGFHDLLARYGVSACFEAHAHHYYRDCIDGVYHITTGGGGASLIQYQVEYEPPISHCEYFHWLLVIIDNVNNRTTVEMHFMDTGRDSTSRQFDFTMGDEEGIKREDVHSPFRFNLYEAYPNPFNPGVVIVVPFYIGDRTKINLGIYDTRGALIKTLYNGVCRAGHHRLKWFGGDCGSGIYFYRLTADRQSRTRKLLLLR